MKFFTKRKNTFWLSLALSISLTGTAVSAHAAQQKEIQAAHDAQQAPLQHPNQDQSSAQRTIAGPYRLTYTLTEMDGSKRIGSQHYAITLDAGNDSGPAELNLGTRIPIEVAGNAAGAAASSQVTYIDIGMSIYADLRQFANGLQLRSRITQSAIDSQQSIAKDPVIRQTSVNSFVLLNEDKPLMLGTVDMPGTTHILQIQVELSKLP